MSQVVRLLYGLSDRTVDVEVQCELGLTFRQVVEHALEQQKIPPVDFSQVQVGSYGKTRQWDEVVSSSDRVELYRPITCDPKAKRFKKMVADRGDKNR